MPQIKKMSYKQQLRESESRNLGLVEYLQTMESICKQVLFVSAHTYDEFDLVVTQQGERFKNTLASICTLIAPLCNEVEDIKLPPMVVAKMVKDGGEIVQFEPKELDSNPRPPREKNSMPFVVCDDCTYCGVDGGGPGQIMACTHPDVTEGRGMISWENGKRISRVCPMRGKYEEVTKSQIEEEKGAINE